MEKIVSFMLCDSINNSSNSSTSAPHLVAPQIVLRPHFVPGNFSFGIAVGIGGMDLTRENSIKFLIKSPDDILLQDSGESNLAPVPELENDNIPKEYQGFQANIDIRNLPVEKPGDYKFILYVNGSSIGEKKIPIYGRVQV